MTLIKNNALIIIGSLIEYLSAEYFQFLFNVGISCHVRQEAMFWSQDPLILKNVFESMKALQYR